MTERFKPFRDYDSTIARIAGNLLSGGQWYRARNDVTGHRERPDEDLILAAVAAARRIVAEVKRTEPDSPQGGTP